MNFLMAGTQGQAKDLLVSFSYENYIGKITLFDNVTPGLPDQLFDEYSILKSEEAAKNYFKQVSPQFIVAIASPPKRKTVANKLKSLGGTNFSYLSTRSNISANTNISEEGVIIQVTCMVSNNVTIERGVLVNVKTEISHNVSIGEYTTLAPDVLVNNGVTIGSNCIISTGVTILPGIKIGNNVKVWMNKVVDKDLPDNTNFI